ncbi:MAG: AbrB/MazE/SpoVT family DNA-binding domain-containing protein [Spirochaetaceae bacterium]|jgi:antitoxin VapB|nr:AbrB/MazE/SpoVT family DNA-binding domain-containing protein [Spirochaetaceae bacterium]
MSSVAKVFMSGRSQAVRIPKAYRFKCSEVLIKRRPGGIIMLKPKKKEEMTWTKLAEMGPCPDFEVYPDRNPPPESHLFDDWPSDNDKLMTEEEFDKFAKEILEVIE